MERLLSHLFVLSKLTLWDEDCCKSQGASAAGGVLSVQQVRQ